VEEGGREALYTYSLFDLDQRFVDYVTPGLEMGRAFVLSSWQRSYLPLMMLWKGIGAFAVRNPRYHLLFGPVSISRDYQRLSRRLMVEFLGETMSDPALRTLVKPKHPPREGLGAEARDVLNAMVHDVDDFSSLIADLEDDNKGLPVLLKHYLKLNGRLLSFNIDPAFGHCIDGLIIVDLRTTAPRILKRFMGTAGYTTYTSYTGA